jgi:hypothetical protein
METIVAPVNMMVKDVKSKMIDIFIQRTFKTRFTHKLIDQTMGIKRKVSLAILTLLTLYSTYMTIASADLVNKTYLIGKLFKVEVSEVTINITSENEATAVINYTLMNPININVRIMSIQVILYSDNMYIWNIMENYYTQEFTLKSTKINKMLSFNIPKERVQYIQSGKELKIKIYVVCEIMEPIPRRTILEFTRIMKPTIHKL